MGKWIELKHKVEKRLEQYPTDITLLWLLAEMEFLELEEKGVV